MLAVAAVGAFGAQAATAYPPGPTVTGGDSAAATAYPPGPSVVAAFPPGPTRSIIAI